MTASINGDGYGDGDGSDAEVWACIRAVARAIPEDVDLDNDETVIRGLFAAGFSSRDFIHVFDAAVEQARINRNEGRS